MKSGPIAILDYGAGNLTSVAYALRHLGVDPIVTREPEEITSAERVIFPGVGAAGASMDSLRDLGLEQALTAAVLAGHPVLGICVGCQIIFERSEEDGGTPCLGLLPGQVRRFQFEPGSGYKVPHMGWNEVAFEGEHPVTRKLGHSNHFYFVHSYYPAPADESVVRGRTLYGDCRFAAMVARENLVAVQFHAEKSGPAGLQLLENFLNWNP